MTREAAYITFNPAGGGTVRPILPDSCREFAGKMNLPFFGEGKVNGFWSHVGFDPGYGYLLIRKADIDGIDFTSSNHSLTFTTGGSSVTITDLCAVHATAVFAVNADKADNLYLLYLEDLRRFGPWGSINRAFNIPTQRWTKSIPVDFYASTLNGGAEWTWTQIVDEVWDSVPSVLGALNKAAASFPSGSPSNLAFHGISAWDALKRICELTGHTFLLTRSGEAKIVASSDADATNTALIAASVNRCLIPSRGDWSTGVSLPEKVRVFFNSHNLAFQNSGDLLTVTELDYYKSAEDPDTPVTWRDVATNTITADPTVAGTIYPARSGVIARFDYDGAAENAADLTIEAQSVAAKIINGIKRTATPRHEVYHGPIAFQPGTTVHDIAWYDFGNGVRTEISSNVSPRKSGAGAAPTLPAVSAPAAIHTNESAHVAVEAVAPPDLYRHHDPYPYVAIVETYEELEANGSAICRVLYGINGAADVTLSETGSLHEITVYDTYGKTIPAETRIAVYFHRQTSRWLVLCERADSIVRFKLQENLPTGGSALAYIVEYDGVTYNNSVNQIKVFDWWGITAQDPGDDRGMFQGIEGMEGWARKREVPETLSEEEEALLEGERPEEYEIIWMEQYAYAIEFTLTSAFTSGSATATVTASWHQGCAPGENIIVHDPQDRWPDAVVGNKGTALRDEYADVNNPDDPYYRAISISTDPLVHFELTSTLALSGDAEAIILSDDGADWADTATAIQVYDWFASEGMWSGIAGYRGYAMRRAGTHASGRRKYDIVWMEQIAAVIQFTTTEYMGATTAGRVAVTDDWYDHQGKEPTGSLIIRDPQGQFPDVHSGAKGTAVYDYHNGYYRIVSCQRVALFATASLTADSCASSMSIDGFAVKATGDYIGSPPTAPTAPSNTCGHAGLDNDVVLLRRTNNTMPQPSWEVVDITKHSKTVMVDVQVSGLTLQKKEITIYAEVCTTTPPSWTTWHTGGECP